MVSSPAAEVENLFTRALTIASNPSTEMIQSISIESSITFKPLEKVEMNDELIHQIAEIIASYRIVGPNDQYEAVMKPKMIDLIHEFIGQGKPINMVVPAFPFKSPNHQNKVIGSEADVGERMTLQHLNSIGQSVQQIYPQGAFITIISDGPCYNDLLGVSDKEVYSYARSLENICERLRLKHVRFSNIYTLSGKKNPSTYLEYMETIDSIREEIFTDFLPNAYNFDQDIKTNPNSLSTYRGYLKFLESDLAIFCKTEGMSKTAARKHHSKVARKMIERGKAFSALVKNNSPDHIRLSIHASNNTDKLSISLLPHERYSIFPVTPWHNTPFISPTETGLSIGRKPDMNDKIVPYKLFKDEIGLTYLRADVSIFTLFVGQSELEEVKSLIEPIYPFGLRVKVPQAIAVKDVRFDNIEQLAKIHSPIIFEGLAEDSTDLVVHAFTKLNQTDLSLSFLDDSNHFNSTLVSIFVQVCPEQDPSNMQRRRSSIPSNLFDLDHESVQKDIDARYCVTHSWRADSAVISHHSTALPVHHPTKVRVLKADV